MGAAEQGGGADGRRHLAHQWAYVRAVARFAHYLDRSPNQLGPEHIREYLIRRRYAWDTYNQARCALFLYLVTFGRDWMTGQIVSTKPPLHQPEVCSRFLTAAGDAVTISRFL